MARTPLFQIVRRALDKAHLVDATGERPQALARKAGISRRGLLGGVLASAALMPLAAACRPGTRAKSQPRIAIIGGGLSGLHCAYRLKQAGLWATIYEASNRSGGRMLTARGQLAGGQLCELGGELIDSKHHTMHALAHEFDIQLDDLVKDTEGLTEMTFYFGGKLIAEDKLAAEFGPLAKKMAASIAAAGASPDELRRIDHLSISAWFEQEAGLPADNVLRRVLEDAYLIEMGLAPEQQSCLNMLEFMDPSDAAFRVFGESDERFHTHVGNDAIATAVAEQVKDQIVLDHALVSVAPKDRGFTLVMKTATEEVSIDADHVVLALPFTRLRQCDLTALQLPEDKRRVIQEVGYGTNAKLMLQFASRPWRTGSKAGGVSFSDEGDLQATWETSRGQAGEQGILTNFVGAARGLAIAAGTADERAREGLPWLDKVFPGTAAAYLPNSALRMNWPTHPYTLGSYLCYQPGQAEWNGSERARIGNLHFCGEHTATEAQGFMEGAAESGARVARELLDDLGMAHPDGLSALSQVRAHHHHFFG